MPSNFDLESNVVPLNVAVIGASGSIGKSALEVIEESQGRLRASVLTVHNSTKKLVELAKHYHPDVVVVSDSSANLEPLSDLPKSTEVLIGANALNEVVRRKEHDVVLLAIVGAAGLKVAWNALDAGQTLALANKEAMVAGGTLLTELLNSNRGTLFPVDSEHSAIYQCLLSRQKISSSPRIDGKDVKRLILTASGGPFRSFTADRLKEVTVEDALKHPTWNMGAKITIDSASMMNKALEIIEAKWLFDVEVDKIQVVIHPQSIIHSMVEFVDGAVLAQLSPPDMRLPIQFALYKAQRLISPTKQFDWTKSMMLEFYPPDFERFPSLQLGFEVAKMGGTAGVVLNAANEIAVEAFLKRRISFDMIPHISRYMLDSHNYEPNPSLERILELDAITRKETEKWISRS